MSGVSTVRKAEESGELVTSHESNSLESLSDHSAKYIALLEANLQTHRELLAKNQKTLSAIYSSRGWKVLLKYYFLREWLFPPQSLRRLVARNLLHSTIRLYRDLRRLTRKPVTTTAGNEYTLWIMRNEPGPADLRRQCRVRFEKEPIISIVVPTYNTPARFLRAMLESVLKQTYRNWELCIADGGSKDPAIKAILDEISRHEPRLKVRFLPTNEGIAGNTNAALALAVGDYVTFLDHDDTLAPFALYELVKAINDNPDADFFYSDEDKVDASGSRRSEPHFKPDWSPDTLRSYNYVCHLSVLRKDLVQRIGSLRLGFEGSQDYDLILRATEQAQEIIHIPKVLYHWRIHDQSTAWDVGTKRYAIDSAKKALMEHLDRLGVVGTVEDAPSLGTCQVRYALTRRPLVSIIIPTQDHPETLARCLNSIFRSTYSHYEILLVENHSKQCETFKYYERLKRQPDLRLLTWTSPFNYAAVNNFAAEKARGEVLLFLNNDVEAIDPSWLERMLEHVLRPDIGGVGCKLYFPDNTVQHAGVVLGIGPVAGHAHKYFPRASLGYFNRLVLIQNFSAVTGACFMTRQSVFEQVQGFDEGFGLAFNDIDICLRIRERGYLIVWTPLAELYHHESRTRGYEDTPDKQARLRSEIDRFHVKWAYHLQVGDPYYNPNLTREREDFSLRTDKVPESPRGISFTKYRLAG